MHRSSCLFLPLLPWKVPSLSEHRAVRNFPKRAGTGDRTGQDDERGSGARRGGAYAYGAQSRAVDDAERLTASPGTPLAICSGRERVIDDDMSAERARSRRFQRSGETAAGTGGDRCGGCS